MIFGVREVRQELGRFSGNNCEQCSKGYIYRLYLITRFVVIFFINLIPLSSRFETVCDSCEAAAIVDPITGKKLAKEHCRKKLSSLRTASVLKLCALALVVAAGVALPLILIKPVLPGPQALKDMVTEDGTYSILDSDGHIIGVVEQADGTKKLTYYEKTSHLVGEPGAEEGFTRREFYEETTEDGTWTFDGVNLERIADNPGILEDRYGIAVRVYHYDTSTQKLGYAQGISDLSAISYQSDRVDYPFAYYAADGTSKSVNSVLYLKPDQQIQTSFVTSDDGQDTLVVLMVSTLEDGRLKDKTTYTLSNSESQLAIKQGISPSSTIDNILAFVQDNQLTPAIVYTFHYFGNTKVYSAIDMGMQDSSGQMQTITQSFDTEEKDGYYLQTAVQQES